MIPVCEPTLQGNELKYVTDCVKTGWISSMGGYVERFEKMFSEFCNRKYGITCSNGTAAIHLALSALGIGHGQEVIVPNFTMIGSVNAIIFTGAKPVFVDADDEIWTIDVEKIEEKITSKTKAIMPVHIYGHPCDMDPIREIADKHGLLIIEDAAEAHGAEYKGRRAGSMSDIAAFSFYSNKIISTGEGGMCLTDDAKLAETARLLRNHAHSRRRFIHEKLGFNYRLPNVQAAIGVAQMERADDLVSMRRKNGKLYTELLENVGGITTPTEKQWAKDVYWMFGILVDKNKFGLGKDEIMHQLKEKGVETRSFFYPSNRQPVFQKKELPNYPDTAGSYPVSDKLWNQGFYLPSSSHLTEEQIQEVCTNLIALKK